MFPFYRCGGWEKEKKSSFDVMFEETDQRDDTLLFPCVVFRAAPHRNWPLPALLAKNICQNYPRFVLALLGILGHSGWWG